MKMNPKEMLASDLVWFFTSGRATVTDKFVNECVAEFDRRYPVPPKVGCPPEDLGKALEERKRRAEPPDVPDDWVWNGTKHVPPKRPPVAEAELQFAGCHLALTALEPDEVCPQCECTARSHRHHPSNKGKSNV